MRITASETSMQQNKGGKYQQIISTPTNPRIHHYRNLGTTRQLMKKLMKNASKANYASLSAILKIPEMMLDREKSQIRRKT